MSDEVHEGLPEPGDGRAEGEEDRRQDRSSPVEGPQGRGRPFSDAISPRVGKFLPLLFSESPFAGIDEGPSDDDEEGGDDHPPEIVHPREQVSRKKRNKVRRLARPEEEEGRLKPSTMTTEQRLLILDTWLRSKLTAADFAGVVGISKHTLYSWKKRFEEHGPAGLEQKPRGAPRGVRVNEVTRRAILMMKEAHPDWGCERIHLVLMRSEGLMAGPEAVRKVLHEEGYELQDSKPKPHDEKIRRFERAIPNQLWQTDLFTFILKREGRRVYLVVFMDDFSRFIVGYGLHSSSSGAMVREVLESAIANYGAPEEVLTDNGTQYHTWRGKSAFTRLCEKRGVRQILARPKHPQTLGKVERFWGTLWRECVESAIFQGLDDARRRVGLFIDHYNFQRPHQGIDGLVPADRYFRAAPEVLKTLKERVDRKAADLAIHGVPRKDFYLTGRVGDVGISLHAEGEQVILTKEDGSREEVNLGATGRRAEPGSEQDLPEPLAVMGQVMDHPAVTGKEGLPAPGTSPLDEGLDRLEKGLNHGEDPMCSLPERPEGESCEDQEPSAEDIEESTEQTWMPLDSCFEEGGEE